MIAVLCPFRRELSLEDFLLKRASVKANGTVTVTYSLSYPLKAMDQWFYVPDLWRTRRCEVVLHIDGNAVNRDLLRSA